MLWIKEQIQALLSFSSTPCGPFAFPLPARARESSETAGSTNGLARSRLAAALSFCAEKTARSESQAALAGCAAMPSRALQIRHEKAERYQNQERIQGLKMPLGAGSTKTMRYENRS